MALPPGSAPGAAQVGGDDGRRLPLPRLAGPRRGALGEPLDGDGPLSIGPRRYPLRNAPRRRTLAERVQGKLDLGVRALNAS